MKRQPTLLPGHHDCCGHWQTRVITIRRAKRREWLVEISHYRNV